MINDQQWNRLAFLVVIVLLVAHMILSQMSRSEIAAENDADTEQLSELIRAASNSRVITEERYRLVLQRLDYIQSQVETAHPDELKRGER